jgi:hypothetical protein
MKFKQLLALADAGVPEAVMLLSMRRGAVQNQDEQASCYLRYAFPQQLLA